MTGRAVGSSEDIRSVVPPATGHQPYGYQARIARDGLPDFVQAPTGAGKTGVILAWLWRRLYGPDPAGTPRRLIYALPQRSLTEQVSGDVRRWLANLGLTDEVTLHVAMGARWETEGDWRDDPHKPAIVIGDGGRARVEALVRAFAVGPGDRPDRLRPGHQRRALAHRRAAALPSGNHDDAPAGRLRGGNRHRRAVRPDLPVRDARPLDRTGQKPIQILDVERSGALSSVSLASAPCDVCPPTPATTRRWRPQCWRATDRARSPSSS